MYLQFTRADEDRQISAPIWRSRPHHSQPGTLREQLRAVALLGRIPKRLKATAHDRDHAWQIARSLTIAHAGMEGEQ